MTGRDVERKWKSGSEWFPTFGVSWQVVQVPMISFGFPRLGLSLSPRTAVIFSGVVLKILSPDAIAARAAR
jgi:hypothetical protein